MRVTEPATEIDPEIMGITAAATSWGSLLDMILMDFFVLEYVAFYVRTLCLCLKNSYLPLDKSFVRCQYTYNLCAYR